MDEHLFDAPLDEDLSFPSLEPVLRDPSATSFTTTWDR